METTKITVQSAIHADVAKVWEYYNQPWHITRWNFADPLWHCPSATNDLRVGGKYVARMEAKDGSFGFDFSAIYHEVIEHEKIGYRLDDGRDVDIIFDSEDGTTFVTVTFDAENQNSVEVQKQGWQAILDNFKKYAEQKKHLMYDFTVSKSNNTITIKREFHAPLHKVWQSWTTAELLDKWWGPVPWKAETKYLEFREGGHWLYSMNGPEGEKHWGRFDYITIKPEELISGEDGFTDENGILNPHLPKNSWELRFSETNNIVLTEMLLTFDKPEDIDTHIEMGFREGITQCFDQLEGLLEQQHQ